MFKRMIVGLTWIYLVLPYVSLSSPSSSPYISCDTNGCDIFEALTPLGSLDLSFENLETPNFAAFYDQLPAIGNVGSESLLDFEQLVGAAWYGDPEPESFLQTPLKLQEKQNGRS